jgi:hypothetical protein
LGQAASKSPTPPKRGLQPGRVDALNDQSPPRVGGQTGQTQAKRFVQSLQMHANELMDLPEGIGPRNHAENGVQQHTRQIETLALGAPAVRSRTQTLQ